MISPCFNLLNPFLGVGFFTLRILGLCGVGFSPWRFFDFALQVINYVIQKIILDKPLESVSYNRRFCLGLSSGLSPLSCNGDGSRRSGSKPWQHLKPSMLEILCNNQASRRLLFLFFFCPLFSLIFFLFC